MKKYIIEIKLLKESSSNPFKVKYIDTCEVSSDKETIEQLYQDILNKIYEYRIEKDER